MRVLITGANGFLGGRVVAAFLKRGIAVRALVRPAARLESIGWGDDIEIFRADLRGGEPLEPAFEDVDVLVHLAACVVGDEEEQFFSTVVGSERLLAAMARSQTKKIVLASTFSVYDWSEIDGVLDEESPLESDLYTRDGYAVAKFWQERIARRESEAHGFDLRVLRPGFIWGAGRTDLAGVGQAVGPLHFLFGLPSRRLPLTHVDNCAEAFALVAVDDRATGQTYNVVDDAGTPVGRWARDEGRLRGARSLRIPVPYRIAYGLTKVASLVSRLTFGARGKLPSLLVPCRFEARFKPLRFSNEKLCSELDFCPALSYPEALALSESDPA
jgi:UDP-glucose 4-epimerase